MMVEVSGLRLDPFHLSAAFLIAIVVYVGLPVIVKSVRGQRGSRLPPGPRAWPLMGNLHLLGAMPHQSLAKLALRHGPLMSMRLGSTLFVVASSQEMAKYFLQTFDHIFASHPRSAAASLILFDSTDLAFAPYGPYWKLIRRICINNVFHPTRLQSFLPIRLQEAHDLLVRLRHQSCTSDGPITLRPIIQEAANNVISCMTLGKKYTQLSSAGGAHDIVALIDEIMLLLGVPNLGDFIPFLARMDLQGWEKKMKIVRNRVKVVLGEIIEVRRAARAEGMTSSGHQQDLLDVLLDMASDEQQLHSDVRITDDNITAVILDMYLGGTDTTSITTEWALAELMANPACLKEVQEELDQVVGKERLVEDLDMANLPYFEAVVQETFRLHPPAPLLLPRQGMQACSVAGYELPVGTCVYVNVWAIGRDPGTWEEPLAFRPERFVGTGVDERGQHFELLPFGSGRRRCVGWELGLLYVHLFLARLLQCFDWKLPQGIQMDMSERFGLTVVKANPLALHASPRLPNLILYQSL